MRNLSTLAGIRTFFLVDGLDECCPQHNHDDFVDTLLELLEIPNSKSCLSSRPWREFALRLEGNITLRLDQLTKLDMLVYAKQRLGKIKNRYMPHDESNAQISKYATLLVDRADGVFLWLELTVRTLGLEMKKNLSAQGSAQIIDSLPSDLGKYFERLRSTESSSG